MEPSIIRVAIVEDEADYAALLRRWLEEAEGGGFFVDVAHTLEAGVELVRRSPCAAAIVDLNLPDSQGPETVRKLRAAAPELPILVVSGMDDVAYVHEAMAAGASDYLIKGLFSIETLARAVRYALDRKSTETRLREAERRYRDLTDSLPEVVCETDPAGKLVYANRNAAARFRYGEDELFAGLSMLRMVVPEDREAAAANMARTLAGEGSNGNLYTAQRKDGTTFPVMAYSRRVVREGRTAGMVSILVDVSERQRLEAELKSSAARLRQMLDETVLVLATAYELRDPYTSGHQQRTGELACAVAAEMRLPTDRIEGLRVAGVLHDIGKIAIPAEILSKPAALNEIEFNLVRLHPSAGHDIVKSVSFPWPVARIILEHHERINGTGYPRRIAGDGLLVESRILAVADVVEAMSSNRPYRPALSLDAALDEIGRHRGTSYDSDVVDACVRLLSEGRFRLHGA